MRNRLAVGRHNQRRLLHISRAWRQADHVIQIDNGTFFRDSPSSAQAASQRPLMTDLSFTLSTDRAKTQDLWAILSPSSVARTAFLQILAGQHFCDPPSARRYPSLTERGIPAHKAIKYVGFDADRGSNVGGNNVRGAYLSARYETRKEETDFSVLDYLTGHTELNALEVEQPDGQERELQRIVEQLNLKDLLHMPVSNLSNGQTRRARIGKALMARPEVLLLDGPFMGLDPRTAEKMATVLFTIAKTRKPQLVLSLRPEDEVPKWITRLAATGEDLNTVSTQDLARSRGRKSGATQEHLTLSKDGHPHDSPALPPGEVVVEMRGVKVSYGDKTVLGDWSQDVNGEQREGLYWSLHRGQRCGIFGANGSGKTTMLSLITSDHPQTYRLPIKLFGRSRLPEAGEPGISVFDLQRRMGHSSPEVHAFFPKQLTVRRALESAWADAPLSKPKLSADADRCVNAILRCFSSQRLLLFLKAIVAKPDLVILDEALSGIDERVRDKALLFLSHGERVTKVENGLAQLSVLEQLGKVCVEGLSQEQALLVISHSKEDVPGCLREFICLPEPGRGTLPTVGVLPGPLELHPRAWKEQIWR
ncbi:ABC transporter domain-containing protein [Zymoseptoria tritici IPO323]|uniref:ABC transporter domain-containing protein n=1 Tax=Zymoseptoria tritici (strain CBS 115943 / IPO323) TaxID=336722 RepID=F9XJA5_ZYMTI|nr:ABC transporter domain-containing protein [Zymoseptoria tritici IPO323]EGP84638.1 ABC transporter domain-containing protein [Zymoseptoria tritici IPO323]